jgi:GGDEF domain-containing protein
LQVNLARRKSSNARYALSLSVGATSFDPQSARSLDELLVRADHALYEQKLQRFASVQTDSVADVSTRSVAPFREPAANSPAFETNVA